MQFLVRMTTRKTLYIPFMPVAFFFCFVKFKLFFVKAMSHRLIFQVLKLKNVTRTSCALVDEINSIKLNVRE